jgi:hypothetical protein
MPANNVLAGMTVFYFSKMKKDSRTGRVKAPRDFGARLYSGANFGPIRQFLVRVVSLRQVPLRLRTALASESQFLHHLLPAQHAKAAAQPHHLGRTRLCMRSRTCSLTSRLVIRRQAEVQ